MAGLVGYDSSDEDEDVQEPTQVETTSTEKQPSERNTGRNAENGSSESWSISFLIQSLISIQANPAKLQ